MIVILEDAGNRLKVWVRKSLRNLEISLDSPDLTISLSNAKKVALAMLKPYRAKVVAVEDGRAAHLLVAVKVRKSTLMALKVLSTAERITGREAVKLLEKPTPRTILKAVSGHLETQV